MEKITTQFYVQPLLSVVNDFDVNSLSIVATFVAAVALFLAVLTAWIVSLRGRTRRQEWALRPEDLPGYDPYQSRF